MKKYEVTLIESCILESTLIAEGNFPKDDEESCDAMYEKVLEGFKNGEATEKVVNSDVVDWNWKELD